MGKEWADGTRTRLDNTPLQHVFTNTNANEADDSDASTSSHPQVEIFPMTVEALDSCVHAAPSLLAPDVGQ